MEALPRPVPMALKQRPSFSCSIGWLWQKDTEVGMEQKTMERVRSEAERELKAGSGCRMELGDLQFEAKVRVVGARQGLRGKECKQATLGAQSSFAKNTASGSLAQQDVCS